MSKDKNLDWLKNTFEKGKLEATKLAKISKLKIEIASLTKKKDERLKLLGKKVVALLDEGELVEEEIMAEYDAIKEIEKQIEELNHKIEEIKNLKYEPQEKDVYDADYEVYEYEEDKEENLKSDNEEIKQYEVDKEEKFFDNEINPEKENVEAEKSKEDKTKKEMEEK